MKSMFRAVAFSALLSTTAIAAHAQPAPPVDQIRGTALSLSAVGEVRTAPDMATISLGVMTQGATADEAMKANAARMTTVVAALKKAGVAERDIQTSGLSLSPQNVYEQNKPPRLTGYQANNQVTVRVMNLARLGATLDACVSAGANEVQGVSFGLRDSTSAEDDARRRAVQNLQAKAGVYAGATSMRVGRMVSLSEGGGYQPSPPRPMAQSVRAFKAEDSTPVSPGELVVRIEVEGLFELVR